MHNPQKFSIKTPAVTCYYGLSGVNVSHYFSQADDLIEQFHSLKNGVYCNPTDQTPITHHQLRMPNQQRIMLNMIEECDHLMHDRGLTTVCQIGVGGSIIGPSFLYHALNTWRTNQTRPCLFISSHDEDHVASITRHLDMDRTLFLIASKSGKTIETKKILTQLIESQPNQGADFLRNQCVAITTPTSAFCFGEFLKTFYFDDGVTGRFSSTSPIGLVSVGLCFGVHAAETILHGAYDADQHASRTDQNIALTQAFIRVHHQSLYQGHSVVSYGESLLKLSPLVEQLICESLGKCHTIDYQLSDQQHAPILMRGHGPNVQHTFFQQLHQGHPVIPVEFFCPKPVTPNQYHILKQIIGQCVDLQQGRHSHHYAHHFPGKRPSYITQVNQRSPYGLGYLIGVIENRIMFEGFLHKINAFDQPGVALSKELDNKRWDGFDNQESAIFNYLTT